MHQLFQHQIEHHKPSPRLHVVAVVSNPVRYNSRYRLFKEFQAYMAKQDVDLHVVELALRGRNFVVTERGNPQHVQVRADTELWHKENLVNIGFSRLPDDWEYAAWIDGDITFLNQNWVHDTLQTLQHHPVAQMWANCIDTGPNGEVLQTHQSLGFLKSTGQPFAGGRNQYGLSYGHSGFSWAIRRDAFNGIGGLIDYAILGAGDHHMAWAMMGKVKESIPPKLSVSYLRRLQAFAARCDTHIKQDIGFVPGTIMHHWHGKKKDRRYSERWGVLINNNYDPDTDIKHNSQGVLELNGHNSGLRDDIRMYMRQRHEDSIDLE